MTLRQLMINKKLEQRNSKLVDLMLREEGFKKREDDLGVSIEEAKTDEEVETVSAEIDKLKLEQEECDKEKEKLQVEIDELTDELKTIDGKEPEQRSKQASGQARDNTYEGESRMKVNKFETRSQMVERLNTVEVRDFYTNVTKAASETRALTGAESIIPTVVVDMIQARVHKYSRLYDEVTVQALTGDARAIVDGALPEAIWTDVCDELIEMAGAFKPIELDQYKVGGFIPVCNAVLEDSMINLANYLEERIARAIAAAVDKAILVGAGVSQKQPEGIIPFLAATANTVESNGNITDLVQKIGLIGGTDTEEEDIDDVIAVMNRQTFYKYVVTRLFILTDDGRIVAQGGDERKLPDGTRIVINRFAPKDTVIFGDFKKYLLGERAGITLDSSTHVRFIQDQTVFKGTARYDGKPVSADAFVVVKIVEGSTGE